MRTGYYKYMGSNGKPTIGAKGEAAKFDEPTARKVLEHLKQIDHRFGAAELCNE